MHTIALMLQADSGLTIGELLRGIPHDFGAVFAYFMVGTFIFLIWYGNRESQKEPPRSQNRSAEADDVEGGQNSAPPAAPRETTSAD